MVAYRIKYVELSLTAIISVAIVNVSMGNPVCVAYCKSFHRVKSKCMPHTLKGLGHFKSPHKVEEMN